MKFFARHLSRCCFALCSNSSRGSQRGHRATLLLLVKFGKWVPWRPNYRSWRHCCWKIHANAGGKQYCTASICYRLLEYQENYPFVLCMKITEFFVSFFFLFKKCCTNHTTRNIWVIHIFCLCNTNLKWVALFFLRSWQGKAVGYYVLERFGIFWQHWQFFKNMIHPNNSTTN